MTGRDPHTGTKEMSSFAEKASSSFATLNAKEVTKSISQAHRERAIIEEKISSNNLELLSTENKIKRLRNKSYDLNEQLNRTSPIMSLLSLDVLTSIFAVACEDYTLTSGLPVQFLIGRVCREWRRVAWSTPHLWRKVLIKFSEERFEVQDALFQEWIGRTEASPLHIHLNHSYKWEPSIAFFNQLLKTCHRWIHFKYSQSSLNFQHALAQEGTWNFPMLKSFNVTGVPNPPQNLNRWPINSPPQLQSLHILSRKKFDLGVNWAALDDVDAVVTLQGCVDMLSLACSFKSLRLYIFASPNTVIPSKAQYRLQHLISFKVHGRAGSVASLLGLVTTPAVKELSIQIRYDSSSSSWIADFSEFSQRSAYQLTKLTFKLHSTSITDETAIFHVLRHMTTLETLDFDCEEPFTLSDFSIDHLNPACKGLGTSDRHVCFLPNLTSFTYRGEVSFSLDSLLRMIKGRVGHLQQKIAASACATKDRPSVAKLGIQITYLNESWDRNQTPSALHDFYIIVGLLHGINLTLQWESPETASDEE